MVKITVYPTYTDADQVLRSLGERDYSLAEVFAEGIIFGNQPPSEEKVEFTYSVGLSVSKERWRKLWIFSDSLFNTPDEKKEYKSLAELVDGCREKMMQQKVLCERELDAKVTLLPHFYTVEEVTTIDGRAASLLILATYSKYLSLREKGLILLLGFLPGKSVERGFSEQERQEFERLFPDLD